VLEDRKAFYVVAEALIELQNQRWQGAFGTSPQDQQSAYSCITVGGSYRGTYLDAGMMAEGVVINSIEFKDCNCTKTCLWIK
jgi:penicillin V acylase-like amidase (Ntn superfamily)